MTRYITIEEFDQYFPEKNGLVNLLGSRENALAFLKRIEVRMASLLNARNFKRIDDDYPYFTDYMKEHYKYALLEQAIYVIQNGDISVDSGYNPDNLSKTDIKNIRLAPNAIDHLEEIGLWNRHLATPSFFGPNGLYGGWFNGH